MDLLKGPASMFLVSLVQGECFMVNDPINSIFMYLAFFSRC